MPKVRYWITTGNPGSLDNTLVSYSLHPNGTRALIRRIKDFANQHKKEAWAEMVFDIKRNQEDPKRTINKFYRQQPDY
jgi:hypothetical protein